MWQKLRSFFTRHQTVIFILVTLLGFAFYLSQSIEFAHTTPSLLWDEGAYIYKGLKFTSGESTPFEDNGLWTNQFPLAYFLPGISQVLFGAGLRSARYFAVILGALSLLGLALAAYRARGIGWAALVVWLVALNPAWIQFFSQVFSQGMVSFFLAWTIFFLVGKNPSSLALTAAAFLSALAGMTRINMLPFTVLLIGFIYLAHGKKAGRWALLGAALPITLTHLVYWPDILKIWAYWVPSQLVPAIEQFRSPWREVFLPSRFSWWPVSTWWHDPQHLAWDGIAALVNALRVNFTAWFGVVLSLFLLSSEKDWKSRQNRELAIFFIIAFFILLLIHFWAALGGNSCQFGCLPPYFLFFNWFGIFALVLSAPSWKSDTRVIPYLLMLVCCLLILVAFEYQFESNFRETRYTLVTDILRGDPETLKISDTESIQETSPFWNMVREKTGFNRYRWLRFLWLNDFLTKALWWILPLITVTLLPWVAYKLLKVAGFQPGAYRPFSLIFLFAFGAVFASANLFAQPLMGTTCESDVITRQEEVGAQLQQTIPAGSKIFWDVKSAVPLLYLPDVQIFLPQANFRYTLLNPSETGDPALLQKYSWWDHSTGNAWIQEADYIVVENRFYDNKWDWDTRVQAGEFNIILVTEPSNTCTGSGTQLIVLEPMPQGPPAQ